ncbi:hypothetical protein QBC45DRAFT_196919 [Copromyces sp. CBS 386.78]|nr:hypothetical protein QBC45DRAFT_196919 [Copromyces sp. CBS 386.78]
MVSGLEWIRWEMVGKNGHRMFHQILFCLGLSVVLLGELQSLYNFLLFCFGFLWRVSARCPGGKKKDWTGKRKKRNGRYRNLFRGRGIGGWFLDSWIYQLQEQSTMSVLLFFFFYLGPHCLPRPR